MYASGVLFLAMKVGYKVFAALFIMFSVLPLGNVSAEQDAQKLLITEVKIGGPITGQPTEFVEVRNVSSISMNLSGLFIEYAKPTANLADCAGSWSAQDASSAVKVIELAGVLESGAGIIAEVSMNDNVGGSLKLGNGAHVYDLVGWGNSVTPSTCKEGKQAPIPEKEKSIKRYTTPQADFIDTNDNFSDFVVAEDTLSGSYPVSENSQAEVDVCSDIDGVQVIPPYGYSLEEGVCTAVPQDEQAEPCQGVVVNEILPNPSGDDTGNEYIELYNTHGSSVSLEGCMLRVGSSGQTLTGTLGPGYKAFYGIVLPNASGAAVEFITPKTEEVVVYPGGLGDDEAWALVDDTWQVTKQPTPNKPNILIHETAVAASSSKTDELGPCPAGKYRNPETNRCKKMESATGLKPCASDQVRNPETNRCKKAVALTNSLKPCSPGQERNPATNRCRKVSSNDSSLKPCKEGQERNPETNRCRKVAGATTNNPADETATSSTTINYVLIALFAGTVILYAIYEYRDSIGNYIARLRPSGKK